jgi:hypothetical protein
LTYWSKSRRNGNLDNRALLFTWTFFDFSKLFKKWSRAFENLVGLGGKKGGFQLPIGI